MNVMTRMNARQLSARLHAAAFLLDTITAIAADPIAFFNGAVDSAPVKTKTGRKALHWTQRPENKTKVRNMNRKTGRKTGRKAKVKTGRKTLAKNVLHWTQRPANKAKVQKMNRASAKKRAEAA
jgi:hypothetical protein